MDSYCANQRRGFSLQNSGIFVAADIAARLPASPFELFVSIFGVEVELQVNSSEPAMCG